MEESARNFDEAGRACHMTAILTTAMRVEIDGCIRLDDFEVMLLFIVIVLVL